MKDWSEQEKALYYKFLDQMIEDGYIVKKLKRQSHSKPDSIPYEAIGEEYNKFAEVTNNPQITAMTPKRRAIIKKAWHLDSSNQNAKLRSDNLEYFVRLFEYAQGSEHLNGNTERTGQYANWRPSFEFMLREDTHLKLREGGY